MIKIILVILVASAVVNMIGGISILKKNDYYFRPSYLTMQWDYWKTKAAYARYSGGNILDLFSSEEPAVSRFGKSGEEAVSIPVLLYHGVIKDSNWQPDEVNVRMDDFREQLFALKKAGWQTISLEDYSDFTQGKINLPEKSFLLTFDDGRTDSYYPVDPVLRALDYSAVMFVISNRSLSEEKEMGHFHLSQDELEHMLASGRWEMGSHTYDGHGFVPTNADGIQGHFLSSRMWLEAEKRLETEEEYKARIGGDMSASKKDLEKKLGIKAFSFAYPFGDFGETVENFPESRGSVIDEARNVFDLSFCQTASGDFPANYREGSFLAKRVNVNSLLSAKELLHILESNKDKPVLYEDYFFQNSGWISGWGTFQMENGAMTIGNTPADESGLAFLNGSYLWKDYKAAANIKLVKNGKVSLAARYHDGNNYMSCDYSNGSVSLTEKINKNLVSENVLLMDTGLSGGREAEVGVEVSGDKISCYLNGKEVVSGAVNENLSKGGISFKIWNPTERDSAVVVRELKVSPIGE
ncbi:MAG: NodB y protein [Patescibacteria group bacterium]|nr:NodB y protein [Patescibacteria group bacterium]